MTTGTADARARARAVLRVRHASFAAACAGIALLGAGAARVAGDGPAGTVLAAVAAALVALVALVVAEIAWARSPAVPAVTVSEADAPRLHALLAELAERLDVPAPDEVRVCPDCDAWLEPDTPRGRRPGAAPRTVLVIGGPFLWWLRTDELRALLAPVVAGTAAAADRDIAAARRWVRSLDTLAAGPVPRAWPGRRIARSVARQLLDAVRAPAELMEHEIAARSAGHARRVDPRGREAAHAQVGLAYAAWERLLTRLAMPAWAAGHRPDALMAGTVAALTELSRRDRLAADFGARLAEPPASDLLADPAAVDAALSRLAASVFADGPTPWPVTWTDYPREVVEPLWRLRAAELVDLLGAGDTTRNPVTVGRVLERLRRGDLEVPGGAPESTYVTALVACAAIDTGRMRAGIDWLDGPVLLDTRGQRADLAGLVTRAVDDQDDGPLRAWLERLGVRTYEPVRLVG